MSIFSGGNVEDVNALLDDVPELTGVLFGTSQKNNMINNLELFKGIK